jgi:hypothetical protein
MKDGPEIRLAVPIIVPCRELITVHYSDALLLGKELLLDLVLESGRELMLINGQPVFVENVPRPSNVQQLSGMGR